MEWANYVAEKNEAILFPAEIRVVGSYTDRLLSEKTKKNDFKPNGIHFSNSLDTFEFLFHLCFSFTGETVFNCPYV